MTFFDKVFNQIFPKDKKTEANSRKYLVQEAYKLTIKEQEAYEDWYNQGKELATKVVRGVEHKMTGLSELNQQFSIYRSPQSNGFYALAENLMDRSDCIFLLEYFKNLLIQNGYYLNHSYRDIYEEKSNVKTKLNYYLKPKIANFEMPLDQKFGNIQLEVLLINDQPDYIKLMANIYLDRNYKKAEVFEDLIGVLKD